MSAANSAWKYLREYSQRTLGSLRANPAVAAATVAGAGVVTWVTSAISGFSKVHKQVSNHRWFWERQLLLGMERLAELGMCERPEEWEFLKELRETGWDPHTTLGAWYSDPHEAPDEFPEPPAAEDAEPPREIAGDLVVDAAALAALAQPASPGIAPDIPVDPTLHAHTTPAERRWAEDTRPLVYVALGDSAAQGVGVENVADCYVSLVGSWLERYSGREVILLNLSISGAVAYTVLSSQLPVLRHLGIKPDLITLDIGGNDVFYGDEFTRDDFQACIAEILKQLPEPALVADIPSLRPAPQDATAGEWSTEIAEILEGTPHRLVPVRAYTESLPTWKFLMQGRAEDYFHPSEWAYSGVAEVFTQILPEFLGEKVPGKPEASRPEDN